MTPPFQPQDTNLPAHLSRHWGGLHWSAWMPLMAAHPLALAQLPSAPGIYRIREVGGTDLLWLGPAPGGVREAVERLSRQVHLPVAPFDDPRGPAAALWRLKRTGASFEVSGAPAEPGIERPLLAAYAGQRGGPPSCGDTGSPH